MIEDITHLMDKERGTAFDEETVLFSNFDDGDVFRYDNTTHRDYAEMFKQDGKANTIEQVLTLPILSAPIALRRGPATAATHSAIEEILFAPHANGGMSTPMPLVIAQMTGAITHKKAFFEKVWTEKNGRNAYDKIAWRPASTCTILRDKKTAAFQGFSQMPIGPDAQEEIKFKPVESFVYIHGIHRNPLEGTSAFEVASWCFKTKQKIRFLWYQFLEGQSLPKTIVQHQDWVEARDHAKRLIGLRSGGVVGMPKDVDINTLESSGKGADQFKAALQWLDSEASGSVLAGFTDLGAQAAGGTGSFALSKDQTDFFLMSRQSDSNEMAHHVNAYLIPDLTLYNFGPKAKSPLFEFGPITEDDANMAISLLQATAVTQSPVLPREFYEELIERVAGFLSLNVQTVRDGLDRAAKEAEEKAKQTTPNPMAPEVARVAGAVDAAARAVTKKAVETAGVNE